jgi:hypothetical protein
LDQRITDSSSEDEIAALSAGSIAAAPEVLLPGFASSTKGPDPPGISPGTDHWHHLETVSRPDNSRVNDQRSSTTHGSFLRAMTSENGRKDLGQSSGLSARVNPIPEHMRSISLKIVI